MMGGWCTNSSCNFNQNQIKWFSLFIYEHKINRSKLGSFTIVVPDFPATITIRGKRGKNKSEYVHNNQGNENVRKGAEIQEGVR